MKVRSDLIIEHDLLETGALKTDGVTGKKGELDGVAVKEEWNKEKTIKVTAVQIRTEEAAKRMERPVGNYITMEIPKLKEEREELKEEAGACLEKQLRLLLQGKRRSIC